MYGAKYGIIDQIGCLYLKDNGRWKWQPYRFMPYAWYIVYYVWKYLHTDLRGNIPRIKEEQTMPDKYVWERECEDER